MTGISSYLNVNQFWKNNQTSSIKNSVKEEEITSEKKADSLSKVSEWTPVKSGSSLVPTVKDGIGASIGDVELSDTAKDYYSKLKSKFGNLDFIAVSKDMKSQVAGNAASYGNSSKTVVLIDEEKLERMATDESFRNKYEGLIAMSQEKLMSAKNSLESSGAILKNFGMSVSEDGQVSFFATVEKANKLQAKMIEKRQAAKKEAKAKEHKKAEKEEREKRLEKIRDNAKTEDIAEDSDEEAEEKEYLEFRADSLDNLIKMVADYAFKSSASSVVTKEESMLGNSIDYKG